jgi:hypothetical protein
MCVFAGVKKTLLKWHHFENLAHGKNISIRIKNKFIINFDKLHIIIASYNLDIHNNYSKTLINNIFKPPLIINTINPLTYNKKLFTNFINRFLFFIKKFL